MDLKKLSERLPYSSSQAGGGKAALRLALYVVAGLALLAPVVQFEYKARHEIRKHVTGQVASAPIAQTGPAGAPSMSATPPGGSVEAGAPGDDGGKGKDFVGAIWRWRTAVRQFWHGYNIYQMPDQQWVTLREDWNGHRAGETIAISQAAADRLIQDALAEETRNDRSHAPLPSDAPGAVYGGGLHPNTPFTVMFLTPLAMLPVGIMTVVMNLLKVGIIVACILMAAAICNHGGKKIPDWVVFLGLAWAMIFIIADIQHGNTNTFAMGALIGSLWLYRKGRDGWAGAGLALAICLKMMPTIFLLYWLYQRGWKVLASTVIWLIIMLVVLPAGAMAVREMADPAKEDTQTRRHGDAEIGKEEGAQTGRQGGKGTGREENARAPGGWDLQVARATIGLVHYRELMETWYNNLISPGLMKASWYPIHINQSMPAVLSRYLLGGQHGGDIFWGPDDYPQYERYLATNKPGWIAVASLDESSVKTITRLCQMAVVLLMAWAIGWTRLARDDGRRGLHYGMVIVAMLMLNQRAWEEHAGAILVATMAVWYAIAFGRVGKRNRAVTLAMAILVGPLLWLSGTEAFRVLAFFAKPHASIKTIADTGKIWSDWAQAYGTGFACFLLIFLCCVILARALKDQPQPYADTRQKLGE